MIWWLVCMLLDMEEECSKPVGKLTLHQPSPPCEFFCLYISNKFANALCGPAMDYFSSLSLQWMWNVITFMCTFSTAKFQDEEEREREILENNMVIPHWWTREEKNTREKCKITLVSRSCWFSVDLWYLGKSKSNYVVL